MLGRLSTARFTSGASTASKSDFWFVKEGAELVGFSFPTVSSTFPKVSCLLVTQAGREAFAKQAIADFFAQRYLKKELVVVAEQPIPGVNEIPGLLRIHYFPAPRPILGELRNHSVSLARGELVAIWDDDDRSSPLRVQAQVDHLISQEADVCFIGPIEMRCACGATVTGVERMWECTMLVKKRCIPRYKLLPKNEDSVLVAELLEEGKRIATLRKPSLYTKIFHGANTWDAEHNRHLFEMASPPHVCKALLQ